MLLEDFLKQCVLLRTTIPTQFYFPRKGNKLFNKGTLFLGTYYQQCKHKKNVYKIIEGRMVYEVDHMEEVTLESIFAVPYSYILDKRRGIHTLKRPFSCFDHYRLVSFELEYPNEINKTVAIDDFNQRYFRTYIKATAPLKEVQLENKNGTATIKIAA